jgi:hypothetical protein
MIMKIPPVYQELLADEFLDRKTRAMILERIRLDEEDAAKEKAAAKRHRLKALADLSLLKTPRKPPGSRSALHEIPPDTQLAPKGGGKLCNTQDYLFLALLLERSRDADYILQCGPAGKTQEWIYLPDNRQEMIPEGFTVKQRRSPQEVRRLFKECFYGFRRALSSTGRSAMSFSVGGVDVRHAGGPGDRPFWDFAARLDHPFHKGNDPLLEGLHSRRFFAVAETKTSKTTPFLCPIDGPVAGIQGKVTSPGWTWRELCGREWQSVLCPHCLGELAETGFKMN